MVKRFQAKVAGSEKTDWAYTCCLPDFGLSIPDLCARGEI